MAEKTKELNPPHGLARLAYRFPIWIYRLGLGGLLGTRIMLLIHIGRKSGQERRTVLEVVRHDKETTTFIVASGFGLKSDWYRNILVNPNVTVRSGRGRWKMVATILTTEQAGDELLDYARRHPLAMRELARFMGYRYDGSQATIRTMGETIPLVAFHPVDRKYIGCTLMDQSEVSSGGDDGLRLRSLSSAMPTKCYRTKNYVITEPPITSISGSLVVKWTAFLHRGPGSIEASPNSFTWCCFFD